MLRIVLDTDIGTDVDDCLAIAFILGSPELKLEGITTVYGDVHLRARMVSKLLQLRGVTGVPIRLGARDPLMKLQPIYWEGHEGVGLLEPGSEHEQFSSQHAVDFIIQTVMSNPGQIHLLAIGPLTNIALALSTEPALATSVASLTIMGGVLRGPDSLHLPLSEHNIVCDPDAAHIVLSSGAPITLVPLDVTTLLHIRTEDAVALRALGDPFHDAVAGQLERYPRIQNQGYTNLHDPLTAAVLVDPTLVDRIPLRVAVETQARLGTAVTFMRQPKEGKPANANVALKVDVERAESLIRERLLA